MFSIETLNYQELDESLQQLDTPCTAAEAHGLISGFLCITKTYSQSCEKFILGEEHGRQHKVGAMLHDIYQLSLQDLQSEDFSFMLLLPVEQTDIRQRVEALGLWCQGFIMALKLAEIELETDETREAWSDLREIAEIDGSNLAAHQENENAYMEVVEHVRVSVMLIYQELQQTSH